LFRHYRQRHHCDEWEPVLKFAYFINNIFTLNFKKKQMPSEDNSTSSTESDEVEDIVLYLAAAEDEEDEIVIPDHRESLRERFCHRNTTHFKRTRARVCNKTRV